MCGGWGEIIRAGSEAAPSVKALSSTRGPQGATLLGTITMCKGDLAEGSSAKLCARKSESGVQSYCTVTAAQHRKQQKYEASFLSNLKAPVGLSGGLPAYRMYVCTPRESSGDLPREGEVVHPGLLSRRLRLCGPVAYAKHSAHTTIDWDPCLHFYGAFRQYSDPRIEETFPPPKTLDSAHCRLQPSRRARVYIRRGRQVTRGGLGCMHAVAGDGRAFSSAREITARVATTAASHQNQHSNIIDTDSKTPKTTATPTNTNIHPPTYNSACSPRKTHKKRNACLDDNHGLLQDVVNLGLDQLEEHVDAPLRRALQLDRAPPDRPHRLPHELYVHLLRVLLELQQDLRFRGETHTRARARGAPR